MLFARHLFRGEAFLLHIRIVPYNQGTSLTSAHGEHNQNVHYFRNQEAVFQKYRNHLYLQLKPYSNMCVIYCKGHCFLQNDACYLWAVFVF